MKQGWEIKKLGEVCDIICGQDYKSVKDDNGKYPIYGTGGIMGYASQYRCPANSVIIGRKGSINNPLFVETEFWNVDTAFGVVPNEKILHPKFFYLFCKDYDFTRHDVSVTIPSLRRTDILKINVPVPPIAEQEKIVAELDCLSGIIEKKKQQLKELDNLAQSIFYEIFGDPVENDKGWEVKKIGEVCIVERGGSPRPINAFITDDENGVNWIKIGDATEGSRFITSTKEKIIPEGVRKSRMVYKGDFILSNSMSFGRPYIMGIDGCIHDGWLVLRDKDNVFDKTYLYYYLGSSHVYQEFKRLAVGGVVNNLNSELVRGVRVAIPSFSVQQDFASKIESIEKQKELIAQSIKETETLFNSRMDYYFN